MSYPPGMTQADHDRAFGEQGESPAPEPTAEESAEGEVARLRHKLEGAEAQAARFVREREFFKGLAAAQLDQLGVFGRRIEELDPLAADATAVKDALREMVCALEAHCDDLRADDGDPCLLNRLDKADCKARALLGLPTRD